MAEKFSDRIAGQKTKENRDGITGTFDKKIEEEYEGVGYRCKNQFRRF